MNTRKLQWIAALAACTTWIVPTTAFAAPTGLELTDVALAEGGLLVGQVLTSAGVALPETEVAILAGDRIVARTTTDANGAFAVAGLRGGQYHVATPQGVQSIRAWAPDTAPPAAREGSLIIVGDEVVRGQITDTPRWVWEWCKQHPWLCTMGVVAAIAVPLAIAADDDDRS